MLLCYLIVTYLMSTNLILYVICNKNTNNIIILCFNNLLCNLKVYMATWYIIMYLYVVY